MFKPVEIGGASWEDIRDIYAMIWIAICIAVVMLTIYEVIS